jgi:hypothetical protein
MAAAAISKSGSTRTDAVDTVALVSLFSIGFSSPHTVDVTTTAVNSINPTLYIFDFIYYLI